jgi:large subunit ribosomal protein L4
LLYSEDAVTAMQLSVRNSEGKDAGTIDVDDAVFGIEPNTAVVHQALVAQLANQRAGTVSTKTRGEVSGSTRKLFRQKGLGRGRQGSIRAPHRRHGGIVFGPKPRDHSQDLPKRMRRLAIRSVLSAKAGDGSLVVLDDLKVDRPSTKQVADVLNALGVTGSALIVTAAPERSVFMSARNLPQARALPADYLNVADLLSHRQLVMTVGAVRRAEALWGGDRATQRRAEVKANA